MDERKKCVHHARRVSPGDGAAAVHRVGHARDGGAVAASQDSASSGIGEITGEG